MHGYLHFSTLCSASWKILHYPDSADIKQTPTRNELSDRGLNPIKGRNFSRRHLDQVGSRSHILLSKSS
jgi:hypothetical protein